MGFGRSITPSQSTKTSLASKLRIKQVVDLFLHSADLEERDKSGQVAHPQISSKRKFMSWLPVVWTSLLRWQHYTSIELCPTPGDPSRHRRITTRLRYRDVRWESEKQESQFLYRSIPTYDRHTLRPGTARQLADSPHTPS